MEIVCPAKYPGIQRLVDAIPILADQGVTAIELGADPPEYFDYRDAYEVQDMLPRLVASGIRVHSVHARYGPTYDISSPDDKVHERGVDALIDAIEVATVLGAERVIVHASDVVSDGRMRRLDRARGVLREVAVVAKQSGAVLALENLGPECFGHTPDEIFQLLNGTNSETIGVCFDSGHANLSGRFAEFMDALLPHAVVMHLHDNDGKGDQHRFPGEGNIDWRRFASAYRAANCDASVILDCAPPDKLAWSEAFQRFRKTLGE
ncbi:MAG: hypothetical protein A2Z18_01265 [Armatimonadetes bacterium RBG_16_58_9]|nr:MAG: hypothetical protein A2Z18_01265 [Armatimonadetes bacterium RBG_16_58_9]